MIDDAQADTHEQALAEAREQIAKLEADRSAIYSEKVKWQERAIKAESDRRYYMNQIQEILDEKQALEAELRKAKGSSEEGADLLGDTA